MYDTQHGGNIDRYQDTLQRIFQLSDPKEWCGLPVTPPLFHIRTHSPTCSLWCIFLEATHHRQPIRALSCPGCHIHGAPDRGCSPIAGKTSTRHSFCAVHSTHGTSIHEWSFWTCHTHVLSRQTQIRCPFLPDTCKVETERPHICPSLMGHPWSVSVSASGLCMLLTGTAKPACRCGKPGQNANPGEHVSEDNKKIPIRNQKTHLMGPWIRRLFQEGLMCQGRGTRTAQLPLRPWQAAGEDCASFFLLKPMLFHRKSLKSPVTDRGGRRQICVLCCLQN